MKRYLDLVLISARAHKKQNRMSILCIVFSVLLVTAIFGMAEMFIRSQVIQCHKTDGNWHAAFKQISEEDATLIAARPDVNAISWYDVFNYRAESDCSLGGKPAAICGLDESFLSEIHTGIPILEGHFPTGGQEALVTQNAKDAMGLKLGDTVKVNMPKGDPLTFVVCGFAESTPMMMRFDAYGIFLSTEQYKSVPQLTAENADTNSGMYYVQFSSRCNIQKSIAEVQSLLGLSDDRIGQNFKLLGVMGQSNDPTMLGLYLTAAVLVFLVLLAGVLMITSSLNSNVAQRTQFFGMLRCVGATPKQVVRLVRAEALSWCRLAIPLGLGFGIVIIWALCAVLRCLSPYYFAEMPVLAVSVPSVIVGTVVGVLTVLLAAMAPARRASRVSPLTAVSGNADANAPARNAANTTFLKVDTALGIHHAKANRKNIVLMTGSFALSIILFLSFSLLITFMNHALTPLSPDTPDLSVVSPDSTRSISGDLLMSLQANPVVERAYGRMFAYKVPVTVDNGDLHGTVDLISYEENQFQWAKQSLLEGSVDEAVQEMGAALTVYSPDNPLNLGDVIALDCNGTPKKLKIVGLLSDSATTGEGFGNVICSEDTFRELFGKGGYTIIDLQVSRRITEEEVDSIRALAGPEVKFSDRRANNSEVTGAYLAFSLFVYGFLAVIGLITVFNVVNSLSMSISARMRQYGAMRAIGMSGRQLIRMVTAEAATYAVAGSLVGCVLGLPIHRFLFEKMVAYRWGDSWQFPVVPLCIIIVLVVVTAFLAVRGPVRYIRELSIVEAISAE